MLQSLLNSMFSNVTFFEWIGFFFGGAVGSLIILGVQALFTSISAKRKYKDEKAHVTHALLEELKICLAQCDYMLEKINLIPNGAYTFPRFNYTWLDIYINRFLDLRLEKECAIYRNLDMIRKKMLIIQDILDDQHMLVATSRALSGFTQAVIDYNESIKTQVGELKQNIGITLPLLSSPGK